MSRNIHIIRATMQLIIRTCAVVTINENSLVINHNVDNHSNNIIFADTCTILFIGISDYHDWSYEFESRSWRGVLYTTWCDTFCQWLATSRWVSSGTLVSSTNKTDCHVRYNWNIVENGVRHHSPKPVYFISWLFRLLPYFGSV
jgi:hypothetical protein